MKNFKNYVMATTLMSLPYKTINSNQSIKPNLSSEFVLSENLTPSNFSRVYNSFTNFNSSVDTASALKFTEVANDFGISEDEETFKWVIAQILLESGAQQYYKPGHPKAGELVVSYADAIGFCQILPKTALYYMTDKLTSSDFKRFKALGATDFTFATSDKLTKVEKVLKAKDWLTNETNNMIMWGKIMNYKLKRKPLIDALIAYNAGSTGLYRYLKSGGKREDHDYIKNIKTRFKYINF